MRTLRLTSAPLLVAVRRMRERKLALAIVAGALAAAAALMGWSGIAAALSQEESVRVRLSEVRSDERSMQVVYHLQIGEGDSRRDDVERVFRAFADVTEPPRRVSMLHRVGPSGVRLVTVEEPQRDVAVTAGRMPEGCVAQVCEALALAGEFRLGQTVALGRGVVARVVGRGAVRPEALAVDSEVLTRTPDLTDEALLVRDLGPPIGVFARETGTSVVTTAALDPKAVRGSSLRALSERLRVAFVEVERTGPLIETAAPFAFLDELADRGDVARERLLLVAGQGAALIVAFAAFAAAARRRDTLRLGEQLTTLGASRVQTALARLVEAALPPLLGAVAGVAALAVAAPLVAVKHGLPSRFARDALSAQTLLAIALVTAAAVALLFASMTPRRRSRFGVGALELAAVVALAMIVWQTATSGALDPEGIEAGQRGGPVLIVLPTLAFLASGVLLLRLLPLILEAAERLARRASFGLRLAFMTAARSPAETAAATTFLAVALGVSLFGLNYRATLDRQARDEAHFAAGAAWRVIERAPAEKPVSLRPAVDVGPADRRPPTVADEDSLNRDFDVTPLSRFSVATVEQPTPALRFEARVQEASVGGRELEVEVLGIPARRIPDLLGWRNNFAGLSRTQIAQRLRPRPLLLHGPPLARDVDAIRFWAWSGASLQRFVVFHFLRSDDQRFIHVRGSILADGRWQAVSLRVPPALRGTELVGLEFPAVSVPQSALPDEGFVQLGRFEQRRGGRWSTLPTPLGWTAAGGAGSVDVFGLDAGPVRRVTQFNLEGSPLALIHPRIGLPEALAGLVSPSVADAAVDGRVTVNIGGAPVPIRAAGESRFFATIVDRPSDFVVVDYDALFAMLNATRPAIALPREAWFFGPQGEHFRERLGRPPFRVERVVAVESLAARLSSDPLAAGAREVLFVAAAAAAALGVLGLILTARATLTAERLLLAEYEALGVRPVTLARSTQLRLIALSLLGVAAGLLGGLLAVRLIGSLVAVTGTAGRPLPPIEPVVVWLSNAVVVAVITAAALIAAALLARRALRETAARRLRA